ncbi:response regulator transcription factor [Streptomyces sp. CBMA156]|uniref:response regulator transcription factor n=1 Tax=Streptomyces sp. CBMA156 TaxID=1930280 RepID=UPI001661B9B8|nr:response regulator transcription factor [Streptomyces sp. CBMA156]MBD0676967.1 DNA-binding response regulator [Streptomyces sp. CBMA156]
MSETQRPTGPVRVLVVDDQQIVREGLMSLLDLMDDIEVVGGAADGVEAVSMVAGTRPQVVLMDLRMPRGGGVEATARIVADHPEVTVLALSTYADDESIAAALGAGARGYLTKDANREQIAMAIRNSAHGQSTFDPTVTRRLAAALAAAPPVPPPAPVQETEAVRRAKARGVRRKVFPDGLTNREVDVLRLIADGLSNPEIAGALFIEEATVKTHINNVFAKIDARNRADAVRYVFRQGLDRL